MADHLRFSWRLGNTFRNTLSDPFGVGTAIRPWDDGSNSVENACNRARVAFEFIEKLGAPFYAFHDRNVAPEGTSLAESNRNLDAVVKVLKEEQQRTGIKLLWATACLFINPRFAHGAATSPNADVFVYAAAQVKKAIDVAYELGAEGYVFWAGREGYSSLWNTDMKVGGGTPCEIPAHGRRLQETDRLQGSLLHRTRTQGTDQTSIRF